jgi:Tol biopolymer transport system component
MIELTTSSGPQRRSRQFDLAVLLCALGLVLVIALLVWRGDRIGVQVTGLSPAAGATGVSTMATVQVLFGQEMVAGQPVDIVLDPAVSGQMRWQGRRLIFEPDGPLEPETIYRLTIPAGLISRQGRKLLEPFSWQFHTGRPRLIYLGWQEPGRNQLFAVSLDGQNRQPLTPPDLDVLDYAVSSDGAQIAFSAMREDGGTDLWLVDAGGQNAKPLLLCPDGACNRPVWSPDGQRLIYERRVILSPGSPPGAPRLWWLHVSSGQTSAVFSDSQWLGLLASFSPSGRWISYVSPQSQNVQVYDLETGQSLATPSQTGEPGAWDPTSSRLLITDIVFDEDGYGSYIFSLDLVTGNRQNLSGDGFISDSLPTWSPDGQTIAFIRKPTTAISGRQVWQMDADGRLPVPLTDLPEAYHGSPVWSPDGRFLTYQRYLVGQPDAAPAIWIFDLASGTARQVVTPGLQPGWLP